jgi:hypothetical protein
VLRKRPFGVGFWTAAKTISPALKRPALPPGDNRSFPHDDAVILPAKENFIF